MVDEEPKTGSPLKRILKDESQIPGRETTVTPPTEEQELRVKGETKPFHNLPKKPRVEEKPEQPPKRVLPFTSDPGKPPESRRVEPFVKVEDE